MSTRQERWRTGIESRRTIDEAGCWIWTGAHNKQGYGNWVGIPIHRLALGLFAGRYPQADNHVHHLCGEPSCFNPEHLKEMSPEEHVKLHS